VKKIVHWDWDLFTLTLVPSYSCLGPRLYQISSLCGFLQFRVNWRFGADGQTDRRTGGRSATLNVQ